MANFAANNVLNYDQIQGDSSNHMIIAPVDLEHSNEGGGGEFCVSIYYLSHTSYI